MQGLQCDKKITALLVIDLHNDCYRAIKQLLAAGKVQRSEKGTKDSPYRYFVKP